MADPAYTQANTPTLQGVVVKGRERISVQEVVRSIGCETKQVKSIMTSLGWQGPFKARMTDASGRSAVIACYDRPAQQTLQEEAELAKEVADLPEQLERVTRLGLRELSKVLRAPFDPMNGNLLKAKVTAGLGAINSQLRADEQRMRTKVTGDALARLLKIIEQERRLILGTDQLITQQPVKAESDGRPADQGNPHETAELFLEGEPIPE
jgi:hypothetical protein